MNASSDLKTTVGKYTYPAIVFHWLLAILIIASFSFGLYMVELPFSPARIKQYNWHKWAGITILTLSAARLLWRLTHRPPTLNAAIPGWQKKISQATHLLLYVLFFAAPLAGWAYSSAAGFPVVYLGLIALPDLVSPNPELVTLHILAALKHHIIDRDGLISRMNPFAGAAATPPKI